MSRSSLLRSLLTILVGGAAAQPIVLHAQETSRPQNSLRSPAEFAAMTSVEERSAALFTEAAKVLEHPRCINCHPATRFPTQGDDLHAHVPLMPGGAGDHGVPGIQCATCHTEQNVATFGERIASVPGTPHWGLAPASMAWQGLSTGGICAQLKDPARNGGRSLAQIHTHVMTDALISWAWSPGEGRTPPPGTLADFGALLATWIETGARCPDEAEAR
jgi:hypothetical protein